MSAKWIIAAIWLVVFAPALAVADPLGAGDRQAIRSIIKSQLDAFQRDDGHEAFSYASPGIRQSLQNPEIFMAMVRSGVPRSTGRARWNFSRPWSKTAERSR